MLKRLRLCNFRPFPVLDIEIPAGISFFVGANAQGKTSLLEAVCLLLRLQSPRTSAPAECVRFGEEAFSIDGQWLDHHLQVKFAGRLRQFALDSKPSTPATEYLSIAKVAWISNSDRDLVIGSGAARRRFLDFLGVQSRVGYLAHLRSYERAVRSRNALLRNMRSAQEVAAFDAPLCTAGDMLICARKEMAAALAPLATHYYATIAGVAAPEAISLAYQPAASAPLLATIEENRSRDERAGTTTTGPHRDDLDILLDGKSASSFASEGQQRSIALALKLAQAHCLAEVNGTAPLYLVDDIFGELDPVRRELFFHALPPSAQALVTSTSLDWCKSKNISTTANTFCVADGKVTIL